MNLSDSFDPPAGTPGLVNVLMTTSPAVLNGYNSCLVEQQLYRLSSDIFNEDRVSRNTIISIPAALAPS